MAAAAGGDLEMQPLVSNTTQEDEDAFTVYKRTAADQSNLRAGSELTEVRAPLLLPPKVTLIYCLFCVAKIFVGRTLIYSQRNMRSMQLRTHSSRAVRPYCRRVFWTSTRCNRRKLEETRAAFAGC